MICPSMSIMTRGDQAKGFELQNQVTSRKASLPPAIH